MVVLLASSVSIQSYYQYPYDMRHADNNANIVSLVAATAAVVAGIGVYCAVRESNQAKIVREQVLLQTYKMTMQEDLSHLATWQDMQTYIGLSHVFQKKHQDFFNCVARSYAEIYARYNCWVKPWNWTKEMKKAFEEIESLYNIIKAVEIMAFYASSMPIVINSVDSTQFELHIHALCLGESKYPASYCVDRIKSDLQFLQTKSFNITFDVLLINFLEKFLVQILACPMYINELRLKEEIEIAKAKVEALQAQALAQYVQANAQYEQANALHRQANAQYAQAHAMYERNEIEENKQNWLL